MVNLGNAWHLPGNPEPFGHAGMRDPVFPTDPVSAVTVFSGNQFQGGGNPGNQLQDGSAVSFKRTTDPAWTTVPLVFATAIGDNKYFSAAIPTGAFPTGTIIQYYLVIAYDDHDTTFLQAAADMLSATTEDETAAQSSPFTFTIETPADTLGALMVLLAKVGATIRTPVPPPPETFTPCACRPSENCWVLMPNPPTSKRTMLL